MRSRLLRLPTMHPALPRLCASDASNGRRGGGHRTPGDAILTPDGGMPFDVGNPASLELAGSDFARDPRRSEDARVQIPDSHTPGFPSLEERNAASASDDGASGASDRSGAWNAGRRVVDPK